MRAQTRVADAPLIVEGLFSFDTGGSERVGADIALECARRGFRVICFAFYGSDGPIRRELEAKGIACVDLNYLSRPRFIRRLTYQYTLLKFFRSHDVSAVHIHHATSLILGGLAARLSGVPRTVLTEHSLFELQTMPKYRRQARRYCRFADAVTVVHPSMEELFLTRIAVPREKLHYVPNGVRLQEKNETRRSELRNVLGLDNGNFLWMFAGRLAAVKELANLIRAFALARAHGSNQLRLVLVGDGSERSSLEELTRSLGLSEFVFFLGMRSDVPRLMTAADGFVMNSRSEGLPMVLLEAMAAHIPCVSTAVGGIPELLANGAGVLVPPGDTPQLASALVKVALNPGMQKEIAEAAYRKVAATNDLETVIDRYLGLFGLPTRWPPQNPNAIHGVTSTCAETR